MSVGEGVSVAEGVSVGGGKSEGASHGTQVNSGAGSSKSVSTKLLQNAGVRVKKPPLLENAPYSLLPHLGAGRLP